MKEIVLKDKDGVIQSRAPWSADLEYAGRLTAEVNGWTYETIGLTAEEEEQLRISKLSIKELYNEKRITLDEACARVRAERERRLRKEDPRIIRFTSQRNLGIPTEENEQQMASLCTYMQALRDIPECEGFPLDFEWPVETIIEGGWLKGIGTTPPPIGSTYWQMPGRKDPNALYAGTTWKNISSDWAGAFTRIEGGNALAFKAGKQGAEVLSHGHSASQPAHAHSGHAHNHAHGARTHTFDTYFEKVVIPYSGCRVPYLNQDDEYMGRVVNSHSGHYSTHGAVGVTVDGSGNTGITVNGAQPGVSVNATGGAENRPENYTVRIWERVA